MSLGRVRDGWLDLGIVATRELAPTRASLFATAGQAPTAAVTDRLHRCPLGGSRMAAAATAAVLVNRLLLRSQFECRHLHFLPKLH